MSNTSAPPAVAASGLRKSFGERLVLDGIDFAVAPGTVFALLGPNGSGKTTTVQSSRRCSRPTPGRFASPGTMSRATPAPCAPRSASRGSSRPSTSCSPARENLALMAGLHDLARADGRRRIGQLLQQFELFEVAERTATTYSGGERRRLDLAMTLISARAKGRPDGIIARFRTMPIWRPSVCLAITALAYLWARYLYGRRPAR